ncbi:MAG: hypothetical protein GF344_17000 [Chitinivibrionales bacterium]|nr:hypothetical protein [Chitinivibrionales bacterium]MBD3358381.1 hypothetical protein [Chitinivibrionales bacterium]
MGNRQCCGFEFVYLAVNIIKRTLRIDFLGMNFSNAGGAWGMATGLAV